LKQANRATIAVTRQVKTVRAKYRRPGRTAQQAGHPLLGCGKRDEIIAQAFSFDRSLSRAGGMTFWHLNICQRIEHGLAERISH
jgi:hypothetical protein